MIPKIIHQTYIDNNLPIQLIDNINYLRKSNPDWGYHFYTDLDCIKFIKKNFDSRILNAYQSINPKYGAARADFFRYLLIYHSGGIYLDIKSSISRTLNEITNNENYLLSHWDNSIDGTHKGWGMHIPKLPNGEFQQWFIAAEPKHPFLLKVIKNVLSNIESYSVDIFGVGKIGVLKTTGPIAYTLAVLSCLHTAPHRLVRNNHILGFVYSIFNSNEFDLLHHTRKLPHIHYSMQTEPIVFNIK